MCLTEYNETETMELFKQEGIQEGMQKGLLETRLVDIRNLMECMGWTAEKTMDSLKIPKDQRDILYAGLLNRKK